MIHKIDMEKYSSAVTLSDMEIFIFPELLYSLVLANIMSPVIWSWKKDPWFKSIDDMTPYKKILRLKQFIMDNFDFNLDLETWGLTTKEKEISRFKSFLSEDVIKKSNALFGYEGDKYYFSIDIRKHFGIDKYESNVIPYWKTETIEAMEAFKYKNAFKKGAGECVSISTLYAAALFIICKIPLENIYLLATPLHSQNFIDIKDGFITNNRRLITKNMWFNGTKLTAKAQRAMRNEQITIVSHNSGFVHAVYPEATMDIKAYDDFKFKLSKFLVTDINFEIFCNFLRQESHLQKCFQIKHIYNDKERYIEAEKAYDYESTSSFKVNESTLDKLLSEIDTYDFYSKPLEDRIFLNKFIEYFKSHKIDFKDKNKINGLLDELGCPNVNKKKILDALFEFCNLNPKLPGNDKIFKKTESINLTTDMDRESIISYLESLRNKNATADLAFYAYRDFSRTNWDPFMKAAIERNPVSIEACKRYSDIEVVHVIENMLNHSIYEGPRLAQPDEVWNFNRGDGLERAICLVNILKNRNRYKDIDINIENDNATVTLDHIKVIWPSRKGIQGNIKLDGCFA
ncbi:MAG: hypothetical protein PHR39_02975 [Actinomycetota bacterium]|nr:hypothetical protein [Actinomycetota bacterium]